MYQDLMLLALEVLVLGGLIAFACGAVGLYYKRQSAVNGTQYLWRGVLNPYPRWLNGISLTALLIVVTGFVGFIATVVLDKL